jgi:gamma-glutamylcyclotransferase (GGCT)/AIG2-like uncharacterized protein YtfP
VQKYNEGVLFMKRDLYVFVYGTLRKGERNHRLLEQADWIAEQCWTHGEMFNTGYGYPAIKQSNTEKVYGELYAINADELKRLDLLEGYIGGRNDNLYDRIKQPIHTDTGTVEASVYVASNESLVNTPISSGDWRVDRFVKEQDTVLYFAYGSCMDDQRFIKHGVEHYFKQIKGRGVLEGYSLRFTKHSSDGGRADIVEEGGVVEGKVYELPVEAVTSYLYEREGVNYQTYRPTLVTVKLGHQVVSNVLTFVVVQKEAEIAPPQHYEEEIIRGATGCLSDEYVSQLIASMNKLKVTANKEV